MSEVKTVGLEPPIWSLILASLVVDLIALTSSGCEADEEEKQKGGILVERSYKTTNLVAYRALGALRLTRGLPFIFPCSREPEAL